MSPIIPLTEFLNRFKPVEADNWNTLTSNFLENEFHRENIDRIRQDIRNGTGIREPVQVNLEESQLLAGQHRVVATILEGLDKIECVEGQGTAQENFREIEIRILLNDSDRNETIDDTLTLAFRSFHVNDQFWAECTVCFQGPTLTLLTECPEEHQARLFDCVKERIQRVGILVKELSWVVCDEEKMAE